GRDRACEGYGVDLLMIEDRLTDDRAVPHHEVENAFGDASANDDLGQRVGRTWHELGRLEHDRVAVRERRRNLPGRNRDRKIPGRDDSDHADGLACRLDVDVRAHGRELFARDSQRLAGEEIEDLAGPRDLADPLGQRLALFAGEETAEFVAPGEDFQGGAQQNIVSLLRRRARPSRESGVGGLYRRAGLIGVGLGAFADNVVCVRRIDVPGDAGALYPLAGDEVLVQGAHGSIPISTPRLSAGRHQINPRWARLRISAPVPNVHRSHSSQGLIRLTSRPSFSVPMVTISPGPWVKPIPGSPRSATGANMVPSRRTNPSG